MNKEKSRADHSPLTAPVGFFDSGVGGLSVLLAARAHPAAREPALFRRFGPLPLRQQERRFRPRRALAISRFLLDRGAKAIVVACNSASEAALEFLRQTFPGLEIVGVEPAVKVAQGLSRNKKIGVLGTALTLKGGRFSRLLENFSSGMEVYTQPVAGLVERIEAGRFADRATDGHTEKEPAAAPGEGHRYPGARLHPLPASSRSASPPSAARGSR